MGLFSRKAPRPEQQIPDELASQAVSQYGSGDFLAALETYGQAIDKIHTMCVVANPSSRIRTPGAQDQMILDGFNNSLGAALETNAHANLSAVVERTVAYLSQIAGEAGPESPRYLSAIESIETTYRLGRRSS
jgi:hypothetical protein